MPLSFFNAPVRKSRVPALDWAVTNIWFAPGLPDAACPFALLLPAFMSAIADARELLLPFKRGKRVCAYGEPRQGSRASCHVLN